MSDPSPFLAIAAPLAAAIAAFLLAGRARATVGIGGALAAVLLTGRSAWLVWREGPWRIALGGWGAPEGIDLYVDGFGASMALTSSVVSLLVMGYATSQLNPRGEGSGDAAEDDRRDRVYWPLSLLALAGMNAIYFSADIFNVYVALEILGIAAVGLVLVAGGTGPMVAGMRYLLVTFAGSMTYLMGVALAYANAGTLDLYEVGAGGGQIAGLALAFMTVALLLKAAFFPVHFWAPRAHSIAAAPVSPLLSALVLKASVYLIIRLWLDAFPEAVSQAAAMTIGGLGAAAVCWGSFEALRQTRLKPLIAYSTVAQLGYLVMVIPLVLAEGREGWFEDAWFGAIYLGISHAFAKAALFMAAGLVLASAGTDRLSRLGGVTDALPITAFAFGIAAFSLIGLPPSAGFAGKWHLLRASLESGQWWWAVTLGVGTLLTAAYLLRATRFFFRRRQDAVMAPVSRSGQLLTFVMALVSLLLGLRTVEAFELITEGAPALGVVGLG